MVEVKFLSKGDKFKHKGYEHKVIDKNDIFVIAKRVAFDGFTRYFLKDIRVEQVFIDRTQKVNPNHEISDRWKRG